MTCSCQQPGGAFAAGVAAGVGASVDAVAAGARMAANMEPLDAQFPVPAYPPADWYTERPEWLTPDTKLRVDDQGRVAGYFYNAGQCIVGLDGACPQPSPTGYAAFHQQEVITADGEPILVGVIGNVGGHADPYARVDVAARKYADPNLQLMSVRAYDDEHGGYVLGAMVPHATYGDVALARRSALSGDWRPMPDVWWDAHGIRAASVRDPHDGQCYDCIGPTLVTRPGLPLPQPRMQRFTALGRAASVLGGAGGIQLQEEPVSATEPVEQQLQPIHGAGLPVDSTVLKLADGTTVTTNYASFAGTSQENAAGPPQDITPEQPMAPAGPHPVPAVAAVQAAAGDAATPSLEDRIAAVEANVDAIRTGMGELLDAFTAGRTAAAALPPQPEPQPLPAPEA